MPARFWDQVNEADLLWSLQAVHGFLQVVSGSDAPATKPFVNWRVAPDSRSTQVLLCTWDRHGLLAKAAASFSAARLSILQAEAFARSDSIVLILFSAVDLTSGSPAPADRLREMLFLLEGALSDPPSFVSVWMCSRHKHLLPPSQPVPRISFEPVPAEVSIRICIEADDRLGLLCDILQTLADDGLDITEAHIRTQGKLAQDVVHVRDATRDKPLSNERLDTLRRKLEAAVTMKTDAQAKT